MSTDTGGLFFPKAIQHVFVGLYIQQICLAALFFLAKTFAEGGLMVALIFFTVSYPTLSFFLSFISLRDRPASI